MSHTPTYSSSSNFQSLFNTALREYQAKTKTDLQAHPLAAQLRNCDSPTAILTVLQDLVRKFDQRRNSNERLTKCLNTTVNILYAICPSVGTGVNLVFPHAKVIFTGIGVLLLAAKDVHESQGLLIDLLERVENFLRRLECYTEIPSTGAMSDMIVKVMVQVLTILAIATKDITQRRITQYVNKLFGGKDIEDALHRLDKLTQDEAQIAIAENLKETHELKEQVLDDYNEMKEVVQQSAEKTRIALQETIDDAIDDIVSAIRPGGSSNPTPEQRQQEIRRWLTPPDPSINHNIARATHHVISAAWIFEDTVFNKWKSTSSLLWIHGKPGSGKSVLCSSIIEHIMALRDAGLASMAYFYFDFRDENKRNRNNLLRSLLFQLSTQSDRFSDILSRLYSAHHSKDGKQQTSDVTLTQWLKEMLTLQAQDPLYLVVDAVDECPDNSGMPSAREQVLGLITELVGLRIPNLHLCVTSRPEVDIRTAFEGLTTLSVSLHEQSGQKKDIIDYINSMVYSDPKMRRWREEDKRLVVETLTERADGMFRWVHCQLESLRHCLPPSVRHILGELPKTLDETYERILRDINEDNREHAHRLLQCLTVAIRPLRVEELAEVLAVDFDAARLGGIPTVNGNWRWDDQQQAILSTCSSLIAVVDHDGSQVVQFSHFSVKEFLTSERLAHAKRDVSRYHIPLQSAHRILAQACLAVLLRLCDRPNGVDDLPLSRYAADYWDDHVRFENVSSSIQNAVEYFLDCDKPHWNAWRLLRNKPALPFTSHPSGEEEPLFYAAAFGLYDIAQHLIAKYPYHVNPKSEWGSKPTPLHAALIWKQFHVAQLLYDHGADVNTPRCDVWGTILYQACLGLFKDAILEFAIVRWLLTHRANVNERDPYGNTPLHSAVESGRLDMIRILIRNNANINAQGDRGTPLSVAARMGRADIVRTLVEHKARVDVMNHLGDTPLHTLVKHERADVFQALLELHVDVNVRDYKDRTPLHIAVYKANLDIVQMLLEHDANVNAKDNNGDTPLHVATRAHHLPITQMLLEHSSNASVNARDSSGRLTRWHKLSALSKRYSRWPRPQPLNAKNKQGRTPLDIASQARRPRNDLVELLLEHGAKGTRKYSDLSASFTSTSMYSLASTTSPSSLMLVMG